MNLVLDEAEEVSMKRKTRKALGTCGCFAADFILCKQAFWDKC